MAAVYIRVRCTQAHSVSTLSQEVIPTPCEVTQQLKDLTEVIIGITIIINRLEKIHC